MNPVVTDVPLPRPELLALSSSETTTSLLPSISPLTLAYFSDAGWYDVDFSKASPSSGPWGRGAGCPFVNEKCIMANGKVRAANSAFFCNDPRALLPTSSTADSSQVVFEPDTGQQGSTRGSVHSIQKSRNEIKWAGCSDDSLRKASCNVVRYAESLPEEYSYFSSTPSLLKDIMSPSERQSVGGPDMSLDYCPVYTPPIPQAEGSENEIAMCTSPKAARYRLKGMEEFHAGARCVAGRVDGQKAALCVSVACVLSDQSLRVKVDGVWTKCQFPGQVLGVWPHDTIVCPDKALLCPTFHCPQDCVGAGGIDGEGNVIDGICNDETGQCMCPALSHAPSAAPTFATTEPTSMVTSTSTEVGDDGSDFLTDKMPNPILEGENNEQDKNEEAHGFPRESLVPCQRAYLVNSENMDRPHWPWKKPPLSDIYVDRARNLVDTPVDIFTRTFRVFRSMGTDDLIGFLAISVVVVLGAGIGGMGAVKAYKRNARSRRNERSRNGSSGSNGSSWDRQSGGRWLPSHALSNVENSSRAAVTVSPDTARFRLNLSTTRISPTSNSSRHRRNVDRRLRNSFRTNKDKAVATMLMDLRLNDPAQKRRRRRRDLLLRRQQRRRREIQERVRHLPIRSMARFQSSGGESVVRHSDLPPLPEGNGRVVAIVGALFIDDVPEDDVGSDLLNSHEDDASLPGTETSGHNTNTTTGGDDTESTC